MLSTRRKRSTTSTTLAWMSDGLHSALPRAIPRKSDRVVYWEEQGSGSVRAAAIRRRRSAKRCDWSRPNSRQADTSPMVASGHALGLGLVRLRPGNQWFLFKLLAGDGRCVRSSQRARICWVFHDATFKLAAVVAEERRMMNIGLGKLKHTTRLLRTARLPQNDRRGRQATS